MADNYQIDVTLDEIFGTGIASVEQTVETTEPGGVNEYTVTLTNGHVSVFKVRNGDITELKQILDQMVEIGSRPTRPATRILIAGESVEIDLREYITESEYIEVLGGETIS
jgi:hypothetical protein